MADFRDLVPDNEQVPINCKTCSKRVGQLVGPYRLTKATLELIMTTGDSGLEDVNGDKIPGPKNRDELQSAYDAEYERYQRIIDQVRINAILLPLDVGAKLELFKELRMLAMSYRMTKHRERERGRMYENALAELRARELREQDLPVNAVNAAAIEISSDLVLMEVVKMNVPPSTNDQIDFRSQNISLQLEQARFPFQDQDPNWHSDNPLLAGFTDKEMIKTFKEILDIPFLVTIPAHKFTDNEYFNLRSVELQDIDGAMAYLPRKYQLRGSTAYSILGVDMICCRSAIGQPTILPGEVTLNSKDIQRLERWHPKILVLSRHTLEEDRPSDAAVAEFIKGKLSTKQLFSAENTMAALATSASKTVPVLAALASIISPGQLRLETMEPTGNGNQITMASGSVQPPLPTFAPSTRFGDTKPVPVLKKTKKTKKVILPTTTVGTLAVTNSNQVKMPVQPLLTPELQPDFSNLETKRDIRKDKGVILPTIQPDGVDISLKDRPQGVNLLQAI